VGGEGAHQAEVVLQRIPSRHLAGDRRVGRERLVFDHSRALRNPPAGSALAEGRGESCSTVSRHDAGRVEDGRHVGVVEGAVLRGVGVDARRDHGDRRRREVLPPILNPREGLCGGGGEVGREETPGAPGLVVRPVCADMAAPYDTRTQPGEARRQAEDLRVVEDDDVT
jgi:hypothetical protein